MDRRRFLVTSVAGALAPPLTTEAQQAGRTYRLGANVPLGREHPAIVAFFDELRLSGFIENQNLTVIPGGFKIGNDQLAEHAPALVKAAPDAILSGPDNYTRVMQQTTRTIPLIAMTEDMVAAGFVTSLARPGGNTTGISLLSPALFVVNSRIFIDRIAALRLPAIDQWPELAEDGGLMGYGPRFTQTLRQLARLVVRVLRGVKPADIPVEQPIHFELVINLKTAKALGLRIPPSLLARAAQVIDP